MREIIANTLSKYNIGSVPKEALKYELMRASLKKEERVLSVDITLNFVVPLEACNEIKEAIWIDKNYNEKGIKVGSILGEHVIPKLIERGLM